MRRAGTAAWGTAQTHWRCTGNGAGRRTGPDARSDARSALGEALGTAAGQTLSLRDELGASLGACSPSTVGENSGRSWELLGRATERQRTSTFTGRELGLHWGSDPGWERSWVQH
jgi:hypothetical protein